MAKQYKSLAEVEKAIQVFRDMEMDVPATLLEQREKLLKDYKEDEYIYNTLKEHTKFPPYPKEKDLCVRTTVNKLLEDGPNATDPVLLLGKIQCGKTDTFENIIGLAFDKGIDICVIFTKGTKALAQQTQERFMKDYLYFADNGRTDQKAVVRTYDIIKDFGKSGLPESVFNTPNTKVAIICKKQADNMKHLIDLFTKKSPYLKEMKVLVCDDEADFASRNYVKKGDKNDLAVISRQIVEFTKIPTYCRYLQVTATPYSLYEQPDGCILLNEDGEAIPTFKPRHTSLVPVHDKYIGGKQYFVESQKPDSMYSHLFCAISDTCVKVMGKRDKRYEKNGIASKNIQGLTYAVVSYIMAAAIRSIQEEKEHKIYKSSALIHADVDRDSHSWQETLVNRIVAQVGEEIMKPNITDERVRDYVRTLYPDFEEAHEKGMAEGMDIPELPTMREVMMRMRQLYAKKEINVQVINSDNDVQSKLDKTTGQLKLTSTCNIFIGGSILDRGITINNMLCFFYGRDPKTFQMDTVLQHCRMYGARDKEDMAVTRFHTTEKIYKAFCEMEKIDTHLRDWFVKRNDNEQSDGSFNPIFIEKGSKNIKHCSAGKIRMSNNISIGAGDRILPVGFQTGPQSSICKTIQKIQNMIESSPYYSKKDCDGFFEIPVDIVREIIPLIRSTYIYGDEKNCMNAGLEWDTNDMLGALEYAIDQTDCDKIWCLHRTGRNMSRYRGDGIRFIDAPDDGHSDTGPSRRKAIDRPVVMFLKENGDAEKGWRGTPFYWPVLMIQENINGALFTLNTKSEDNKDTVDASDLIKDIPTEDILRLTLKSQYFWEMLQGVKDTESRNITDNTAGRFLVRDFTTTSGFKLAEGVEPQNIFNINAANEGVFPFVFRPYKYVLFRTSRDKSGSLVLMKIDKEKPITPYKEGLVDADVLINREGKESEYEDIDRLVQWGILINMTSVVGFKLNERDQKIYEKMQQQEVNA